MGRERGPPGDKKPATAWCSGRSRSRPFSVVAGAVSDRLKAWPALLLVGWRLSADSGPSRPHPGTGGFDPKRSLERVGAYDAPELGVERVSQRCIIPRRR